MKLINSINIIYGLCISITFMSSSARIADVLNLTEQERYLACHYAADDLYHIGKTFNRAGMYQEALEYLHPALALSPEHAASNWEVGDAYLALGDILLGFEGFAYRWKYESRFDQVPQSLDECAGKRVLIAYQWHMINTMLSMRYFRLLKELGATVLLEVPSAYVPLMQQCPFVDRVITFDDALRIDQDYDIIVPSMHLPTLFKTTIDTVPKLTGSLAVSSAQRDMWFPLIAQQAEKSCSIGVFVSAEHTDGLIALLQKIPNIALYVFNDAVESHTIIRNNYKTVGFSDYSDFAAFISQLDVVITSDAFTALCADALGVLTWALVKPVDDWFWLTGSTQTPWCNVARIYRQKTLNDMQVLNTLSEHAAVLAHSIYIQKS